MRDEPLLYTISDGTREGSIVIRLSGPLTLGNMFEFQADLRTIEAPITVIDLSGTPYMDSAGMGMLINFYVHAEKQSRKMALAGVNERVEALLDMTHTKALLRVYPTAAEAEAAA